MTTPEQETVIYDGQCGFCRHQVERLRRMDRRNQFRYLPFQEAESDAHLAHHDFANRESGMRFISADDRLFIGADAVYQIARRLTPWRWIVWIYRLPLIHALCKKVYAWIARNRYRLSSSCETDTCNP